MKKRKRLWVGPALEDIMRAGGIVTSATFKHIPYWKIYTLAQLGYLKNVYGTGKAPRRAHAWYQLTKEGKSLCV